MNISEFLGRLHPLIVHLPIGFLILAILLEWVFRKKMTSGKIKVILFTLLVGVISAIIAAVFGWLLANEGGYNENTLIWHRWLGIITVLIAILAYWSRLKSKRKVYISTLVGLIIFILFTGHFGGSLTHGSDYLLNPLIANKIKTSSKYIDKPKDSVMVYSDLIEPIIQEKCISCHGLNKQNGGLDLSSWETLNHGGDNGKIITGNVWESELFKRVTLPQQSKKFMPPKGIPLTFSETIILKWWIEHGASSDATISTLKMQEDIKNVLFLEYNLDVSPKPFAERISLDPVDPETIQSLNSKGWSIKLVSPNSNLFEATPLRSISLNEHMLMDLLKIKAHITWLKLGRTEVLDTHLKLLSQFSNLSDLRLDNTLITDEGLQHLSNLSNLETLNLYNTTITDKGLGFLKTLKGLKRIYLWKTKVSIAGLSDLQQSNPDLKIISD